MHTFSCSVSCGILTRLSFATPSRSASSERDRKDNSDTFQSELRVLIKAAKEAIGKHSPSTGPLPKLLEDHHTNGTHSENALDSDHQFMVHSSSYDSRPPKNAFWGFETDEQKHLQLKDMEPDPEELASRPLLSLVMIVKNEAQSIIQTIDSVKGIVDRYTILDTGSTDGTPALIRKTFGTETPGDIYVEEFVDFSTTRNRAIELEGTRSVFALMLSGGEYLEQGVLLRKFLEPRSTFKWVLEHPHEEAYLLRILYCGDVYDSVRVHRTDCKWFYVGPTHEYITNFRHSHATQRAMISSVDMPTIYHDLIFDTQSAKKKRWKKDAELLERRGKNGQILQEQRSTSLSPTSVSKDSKKLSNGMRSVCD